MEEIFKQVRQFQKVNNWQGMIQVLTPICKPDQWGWQEAGLISALGFAHSQMGDLEQAKQCYQRWIEIEPDRARPFYCYGYIFYLEQDWREAIRWFEQALKLYPDYLICLYRLAYAYFEFQKPRESIPLLQKLLDIYQSHTDEDWRRRNRKTLVKAQFLLAKSYYRKRRYDEALALIQKLLNQDTKHFVALEFKFYALGKILAALNREEEALRYLKQALDPQHPQPYVLDQTGRVYHQLGDYPEALQQYSRALKIRKLPFIFANRAETYLAIDKIGLAVRDLHQALKRDRKGKHKIYLRLGQINLNGGKLIEAFHYFQSAIRYKQKVYGADYAEAHYALVFYHLQNDQQDLARREMQTALEITPNLEWDTSLREVLGMQPVDENYSESYF